MYGQLLDFIIVVTYFVASVGGLGWGILGKAHPAIAIVIILGAIGFPQFLKSWRSIRGDKTEKKEGQ